jgi:GNAT superfamily N-acetyltransferase
MNYRDTIHCATKEEADAVRALFREYGESLDFDLCFQGFGVELEDPFASYEAILISGQGCVALRRIDEQTCEMKRLYVRPAARGRRLGHAFAASIVQLAKDVGYKKMMLDTVPSMVEAINLYRSLGFKETHRYRYNPIDGALYFELDLTA